MATIAHMATHPPRARALIRTLDCLHEQVDRIELILNEYSEIPAELARFERVRCHLPATDLKDTAKFSLPCQPEDDIFLCDDDLLYPPDYVAVMKDVWQRYASLNPIVGVHGILYPDSYDGTYMSRHTVYLGGEWRSDTTVHQLGTGTVLCKGWQMPGFDTMQDGQRYVDLLFAHYAFAKSYPLICLKRDKGWLSEIADPNSIFNSFTKQWPEELVNMAKSLREQPLTDLNEYRSLSAGC